MTQEKKFKRAVRERMSKTGESYTAARAQLDTKKISVVDLSASSDSSEPSVFVTVPGSGTMLSAMMPTLRRWTETPPELVEPITNVCARLAAQMPAAMVSCWSPIGKPICEIGGDEARRQRVREFAWPPYNAGLLRAIDFLGPLPGGFGDDLLSVRRFERGQQLLVLFSRAGVGELELARTRIGHAALAIERLLADLPKP